MRALLNAGRSSGPEPGPGSTWVSDTQEKANGAGDRPFQSGAVVAEPRRRREVGAGGSEAGSNAGRQRAGPGRCFDVSLPRLESPCLGEQCPGQPQWRWLCAAAMLALFQRRDERHGWRRSCFWLPPGCSCNGAADGSLAAASSNRRGVSGVNEMGEWVSFVALAVCVCVA
jgi:hypothetical protein